MTDNPSDPWQSLASELGVQPGTENAPASKPPALPPVESHPPRVPPRSASPPPPAKKPSADWQALAGALGIEIPAEPTAPPARKDPVAELLGFPPPLPNSISRDEDQRRSRAESKSDYYDDDMGDWDSPRSDRDAAADDLTGRKDDENRANGQRSGAPQRHREDSAGGDDRNRGRRRGRRGGRGRSSGEGRGGEGRSSEGRSTGGRSEGRSDARRENRPGDQRRFAERDAGEEMPRREEVEGDDLRPVEAEGEVQPRGGRDELQADELRRKRRRRGRRGRGSRDRTDRPKPPSDTAGSPSSYTPSGMREDDVDLGIDFEPLPDEFSSHDDASGVGVPSKMDVRDNGDLERDDSGLDDDGPHDSLGGKSSVRDILTWKDAIGMIIEGNMQTRSRSPQNSHPPRGSRGRGRGRGRGGHR